MKRLAAGFFKGCSLEALQDDEDDDAAGKALQGVQGAADEEEEDDDDEEACKGFQGCSLKDDAAGFFKGLQR